MIQRLEDLELIKLLDIKPGEKVLDVGASGNQREIIRVDTVVDLLRPEEKLYNPAKLRAKNFVKLDITRSRFPFKDKEFDICLCTHTLEDLSYPFLAIEEMGRVAKRGFIATPSRGWESVFQHYNITEWGTGPVRFPGLPHHHWVFEKKKGKMYIVPKNYPLLYSSEFQYIAWNGPEEFRYSWNGKIEYEIYSPLTHHELIEEYRDFFRRNKRYLKKGIAAVYVDNPYFLGKELIKWVFKRGLSYEMRSRLTGIDRHIQFPPDN